MKGANAPVVLTMAKRRATIMKIGTSIK